jgi:tetratricopeptide (TPR) repeat protein
MWQRFRLESRTGEVQEMSLRQAVNVCGLLAGTILMTMCGAYSQAAEEPEKSSKAASSRLDGLQIQPGDEPLKTFQPVHPATPQDRARGDAMALFMAGRVQQEKGEFDEALKSYMAAAKKDPQAIEPYKSALPILLQKHRDDEASELALAAAEHNHEAFELIEVLAAIFAKRDNVDEGIELLQAGLKVPGLMPDSVQSLNLHRDLGRFYRVKGDFKQAAEQYQIVFQAVTEKSLSEEDLENILVEPGAMYDEFGDTFLKAELPELALKAFDQADHHREAKPGLHSYNLATVFRQTGKPEKALEELNRYFEAQLQTRGRAAYVLLKDLLTDLKRQDELLPRLEKMHKQDEHNDVLRYFLADELLAQGDVARAEELYTGGRESITDPRALVGMLTIYRQKRDSARLLTTLSKAFQTVPRGNESGVLQNLSPDIRDQAVRFEKEIEALEKDDEAFAALTKYARSLEMQEEPKLDFFSAYLLGKLATENDHTDDAIHFYKLAISMRNDPPALLFNELGMHLLDAERYDDAIAILNEAAQHPSATLQREKWRFLFFLSYAYAFQGDTERALEVVREAQKLQPNYPQLHYQEAWIIYHAKRWDDALAMFNDVISNYSNDKDLVQKCRFHISNIWVEKGDMAQGEQVLEDVLKEDPDNPQANNDLGYLFADQNKNLVRAEKMIRTAVENEPENPAYLDSLGWVLYRKQDYKEALKNLEKATSLKNGDDSTIIEHLGDCLDKMGRHDEAQQAWQRALKVEEGKKVSNPKVLKSLKSKVKVGDAPTKEAAEPAKKVSEAPSK